VDPSKDDTIGRAVTPPIPSEKGNNKPVTWCEREEFFGGEIAARSPGINSRWATFSTVRSGSVSDPPMEMSELSSLQRSGGTWEVGSPIGAAPAADRYLGTHTQRARSREMNPINQTLVDVAGPIRNPSQVENERGRPGQDVTRLRLEAEQGSPRAQRTLGLLYHYGLVGHAESSVSDRFARDAGAALGKFAIGWLFLHLPALLRRLWLCSIVTELPAWPTRCPRG